MKKLYFDDKNARIYWSFADDSSYIQIETNLDSTNTFVVMHVPQYGGLPNVDSYCNTIQDAIAQLEMVSM
tara:strand:- start:59 stop:268 length:210 start_codon:yes stop_codon:yes gene_type:complete